MSKLNKDTRYTVRVTEEHHNKLMEILKQKGLTVSQWVREKIEQARLK